MDAVDDRIDVAFGYPEEYVMALLMSKRGRHES